MKTGFFGWPIFVLTACAALSVAACSGSEGTGANGDGGALDNQDSGSGGHDSGGNNDGGPTGDAGRSPLEDCRGDDPSCTPAELETYRSCLVGKCNDKFKECYGAGYESGSYGGACGTFMACVTRCGCADLGCLQGCGTPPEACTACLEGVSTCVEQCPEPSCFNTEEPPPDGQCADLLACCNSMQSNELKQVCLEQYDAIKSNDAACGALYQAFQEEGECTSR